MAGICGSFAGVKAGALIHADVHASGHTLTTLIPIRREEEFESRKYVIIGAYIDYLLIMRHYWRMKAISDFGIRLRAERARRSLSQADLARLAGIPHRSYQRLEAGDPGVRLTTLLRAFGALGLELTASSARRPTLDELGKIYDNEASS